MEHHNYGTHFGIDTRVAVHGTVETLEHRCYYGNKGEASEFPGLVWVQREIISLTYSARSHGFSVCFRGSSGFYLVGNVRNVQWGEPLTIGGSRGA